MNKNKARIFVLSLALIGLVFGVSGCLKKEVVINQKEQKEVSKDIPQKDKEPTQIKDCFQTKNDYPAEVCFSGFNPNKAERAEIEKKLINPMVDYYNEDSKKINSLTIKESDRVVVGNAVIDNRYRVETKSQNGDEIDRFSFGRKGLELNYWVDDSCMGPCICSDKFIKKYPEAPCISKKEAAIVERKKYELDEVDVDNSAVKQGKKALIEGSLSFPLSIIPRTTVCAVNKNNEKEKYCTNNRIKSDRYLHKIGYQILVPAGEYYVRIEFKEKIYKEDSYQEYYTKKIACSHEHNCDVQSFCPSCKEIENAPFIINIELGETFTKADIIL